MLLRLTFVCSEHYFALVVLWLLCNDKCYRKLGHYLTELFYYNTLDVFCSAVFFKHIKSVTETILELRETETALDVKANTCQSLQILLVIVPWHLNEQEINTGNVCVWETVAICRCGIKVHEMQYCRTLLINLFSLSFSGPSEVPALYRHLLFLPGC